MVVAQNRRARFDYEVLQTLEAGMQLTGQEAKSCRTGGAHLIGSYVSLVKGVPTLKNANISRYKHSSPTIAYDPLRDRPLLLKKSEIAKLETLLQEKGLTVIPLEMNAGKYIKLTLGVCKGRKTVDKRHAIKRREVERQIREGRSE